MLEKEHSGEGISAEVQHILIIKLQTIGSVMEAGKA